MSEPSEPQKPPKPPEIVEPPKLHEPPVRIRSELRAPGTKAVRPRDAASLVILKEGAEGSEVLMGRRRSKSKFMPGAYVFPGGRVDAADARARPATALVPEVERLLLHGATQARARTLAMTAVRETFEETGLVLGRPGDPGGVRDESWAALRAAGMAADLAALDFVARAITRHESPVRFDARFFMVAAERLSGALGGSGELLDLAFVPLETARELPSAMITQFVLSEVLRLAAAPRGQRGRRAYYRWRSGQRVVDYV
jgi:8-oxo-dGTP pyrophosphatase MutT (NUDIX family)